jgi:[calcium/calmodulin-dependent protein kinase] kinase
VLQRLKHANLVKLHEVLDDPKDSKVYLIMELVERGELIGDVMSVKPFSNSTARRYFRDVLCGLAYLHVHGVVHCDLKVRMTYFVSDANELSRCLHVFHA